MTRVLGALDRHWFAPGSLRDLAVVRIVVAAATWYFVLPRLVREMEILGASSGAGFTPLPALKVLLLPLGWEARPPLGLLEVLFWVAQAAAVLGMLGLFSRAAIAVLAYCTTVLVTHNYSYGELHHPQTLIVIMLWVLPFAPIGRALSLDAIRRRWRVAAKEGAFRPEPPDADFSIHATWPLRLGQWLLVLAYLSAAWSKIDTGAGWMNGTTLAYYLAYDGMMWDRPLGVMLAQLGWLMLVLSVVTIVFEATFGLAVLIPRIAWVYVATGIALHIGIYLTQRAPFFTFLSLYIVFLPSLRQSAAALMARLRRADAVQAGRTAILYDGLCPLCIRTMAVVDVLDAGRRLEYVDLEADWAKVRERAPALTRDDVLAAMHVVTPAGQVYRGFDGFRALAGVTPALRPFAPLLYVPPVPPIGRRVYGWIAAHRPRRLCRDVCEL